MTYPVGQWTFDPIGYPPGAVLYYGPILFPAGIDPGSTQTAVCVFGPAGGRVNVPPVFDGQPGQPPTLNPGTATTLAPGASATFALTQTSPGGPGVASVYTVDMGIPKGATGAAAANTLISPAPSDLEGTPGVNKVIGYNVGDAKAQWQPLVVTNWYNVTGIAATGTGAGQTRSITSITIPAQPKTWIPIVFADCTITGTANTQVDLVARLGGTINTTSGAQVARGRGQIGAITGANPWIVNTNLNFPSLLTGGYAQTTSGTATIYLNCEQQASTTDLYSTGVASLTVGVAQLP